jgi:ribose transport system permease protein
VSENTKTLSEGRGLSLPGILKKANLQEGAGLVAIYILILVVMSILSPYFLTARNFINLILYSSTIGIIAMFTTMLMVGGGLDLSVGSTVALVGVVISHAQYSLGVWGAVALGVLIGVLVGVLNGLLVTRVGINALIATLGMLSVTRGFAFVFSGGLTEPVMDPAFGKLGRGFILGLPVPVIVLVVLVIGAYIVMRYTNYGRAMYSIGGNAVASHLAGLPVRRYQFIAFVLSGLSAGVASVFLTSQLGAGAPQAAMGLELSVIAAVILGGTSLTGGKGTILGTLIGVLILGTLNNGMVLLSVSSYYQQIAQGLVLLLAVGLDQFRIGAIGRKE